MGFHYKNFVIAVVMCVAAFGGFFSFVYSAEQAKNAAKGTAVASIPEKQYDKKEITRIHEIIIAAQQRALAQESARLVEAQQAIQKQQEELLLQAQQASRATPSTPPIVPVIVPKINTVTIPSLPAPSAPAPLLTQPMRTTQPRTAVS